MKQRLLIARTDTCRPFGSRHESRSRHVVADNLRLIHLLKAGSMNTPFLLCARKQRRLSSKGFVRWCNGSTRPFGGLCPGSNPGRTANLFAPATTDTPQLSEAEVRVKTGCRVITDPSDGSRAWTTVRVWVCAGPALFDLRKGPHRHLSDPSFPQAGWSSTRTCWDLLAVSCPPGRSARHSRCKWSDSLTPSLEIFDQKGRPASETFPPLIHKSWRGKRQTRRRPMLLRNNNLRSALITEGALPLPPGKASQVDRKQ
jgi:hypothetical protein